MAEPARDPAPGCALCAAEQLTPWFHEDDRCWVAECLICRTPMVVWRRHGPDPPAPDRDHMLARLAEVAATRLGGAFRIDPVMRRIPDHFHAHARDPAWPGFAWSSQEAAGGRREDVAQRPQPSNGWWTPDSRNQ